MDPRLAEGIHLFNTQQFFEAHEALEAVWLEARGDEKIFLHGLIQIAAAFHHHRCGNPAGLRSLLEKGLKKLEGFKAAKYRIDLASLRKQLKSWRDFLAHSDSVASTPPPLPHIRWSRGHSG